jgi:membrane protease YdiL (CAAX protease family)
VQAERIGYVPAPPSHSLHNRLRALAEVVLCSGVPTQTVIGAILVLAGLGPASGDEPGLLFVTTLLLADTVVLLALMVAFMSARGESPRAIWLGQRSLWRETLLGVSLVPSVFLLVAVLLFALRTLAPWLHNVPANPLEEMAQGGAAAAALFGVVAIIGGGVREELQRAFMLRRFEQHLGGPVAGVLVLSVAFGLGHFVQGWDAVVTTGALGAFWAVLYLRRRSCVAPLVSHAGFNSLEVLRVALLGG